MWLVSRTVTELYLWLQMQLIIYNTLESIIKDEIILCSMVHTQLMVELHGIQALQNLLNLFWHFVNLIAIAGMPQLRYANTICVFLPWKLKCSALFLVGGVEFHCGKLIYTDELSVLLTFVEIIHCGITAQVWQNKLSAHNAIYALVSLTGHSFKAQSSFLVAVLFCSLQLLKTNALIFWSSS